MPINTRRANCSSLTGARCSQPTNYTEETIWWARGKEERDKFVNFKYDCDVWKLSSCHYVLIASLSKAIEIEKNHSHSPKYIYWRRLKNKNWLLGILYKVYFYARNKISLRYLLFFVPFTGRETNLSKKVETIIFRLYVLLFVLFFFSSPCFRFSSFIASHRTDLYLF